MSWRRWGLAAAITLAVVAPTWAQTVNRIVAFVNDELITEGDVNIRVSGLLQEEDRGAIDSSKADQMRRAVVQRLIEERLMIQEAKRLGVTASSEEVVQRLTQLRQRLSKEQYEQMLAQAGLNEEQLKSKIREQVLVQKAIDQAVRSKVQISLSDLAGVPAPEAPGADEVRVQHLLIRVTPERSADDAKLLATRLHTQLVDKRATFEELAHEHSEDPHASEGGELGWLRRGQLLPELDDVLFALKPGEVSEPIQTRLGFHLVKVLDRRSSALPDGMSPKQALEYKIYHEKFTQLLDRWIGDLKAKAYIRLADE